MTTSGAETPEAISAVTVIGAGTMGQGIAQVAAEAGIRVTLFDADPAVLERGKAAIVDRWDQGLAKDRYTVNAVADARENLSTVDRLADGKHADLVIEAIIEDQSAKVQVLRDVSALVDAETLIASNTSSISITRLGAATNHPQRVVGLHFFNPVPVLPLVEVVRGLETSDATVHRVMTFARALGKTPVVVNDAPGFVANRVLLPMINEAIYCLMEGVATKEAIDDIMKLGMAHPIGPLALADLIGLDVCLAILTTLQWETGDDKYRPAPLLRRMVDAGHLGRKRGQGFFQYER